VQAGFLLSLVQLAGMSVGLAFGALADSVGGLRSMTIGLVLLAIVSALGGFADAAAPLMVLRAAEGFGFLLVVLPAPGLVRALVEPQRVSAMIGLWGAYMPFATALALLFGPLAIAAIGWRGWWWDARRAVGRDGALAPSRRAGRGRPARDRGVAALARAPAPDARRARTVADRDVVRDVLGAVARGRRLPAVDLSPERHRRCRGGRAHGRRRRRQHGRQHRLGPAAAARRRTRPPADDRLRDDGPRRRRRRSRAATAAP
jgi:hypothetical protein